MFACLGIFCLKGPGVEDGANGDFCVGTIGNVVSVGHNRHQPRS